MTHSLASFTPLTSFTRLSKALVLVASLFVVTGCANMGGLGAALQPITPKVGLSSVKMKNFSPAGINFDFNLAVDNPNGFDLKLNGFDYKVKSLGQEIANGLYRQPINLAKNAKTPVTIPLAVEPSKLLNFFRAFLGSNKSAKALMEATVFVDSPVGELSFDFADEKVIRR